MGKIKAICTSREKGIPKEPVKGEARLIADFGLEGDAHGGNWHRQVSLLSYEKIEEFKKEGAAVKDGSFGENLIIEGIDLKSLPVGSVLKIGEALIEITQIGKECHDRCVIGRTMGKCIMPSEGIFARVLKGGTIKAGDEITAAETAEEPL